jgi:uncharacterized BrkB/YihY/UPF0761 family membrane protein
MSLGPEPIPMPDQLPEAQPQRRTWQGRLLSICFIIFTVEIGLFLVIVPWMEETWSLNTFQELSPVLQTIWIDPYFRGAITGLGLVNVYIALHEVVRLFRRP